MLDKCNRLQWSLGDIDWDAPGSDCADDRLSLAGIMGDLYWIESVAAMVFGAMRDATNEPELRGIFASFAIDEQRHADAELMLMRRWDMVGKGETPAPNVNVRNLLAGLERGAHRVHPAVYSAIIPFTELVLDGALVKHFDALVRDPIAAEVFRRINADEARHLAVDFHVLERFGNERSFLANTVDCARAVATPMVFYALVLGYLPMIHRGRANLRRAGLADEQLFACIRRYIALGKRSEGVARHPAYALYRLHCAGLVSGRTEMLEVLLRLSDVCERLGLRVEAKQFSGGSKWMERSWD
jgi:predicted metal-dependent hydrolase